MPANRILLIILAVLAVLFTGAVVLQRFMGPQPDVAQQETAAEQQAAVQPDKPAAPEAPPEARSAEPSGPSTAVPSYDVVRIEKGGEGVIAGKAEPGWRVIIQSGDKPVAEATAGRDGEWVAILKEPLEAGEHSLSLHAYSADGNRGLVSDQTVVVSVAGKQDEETVVALAEPGKPTQVLQQEAAPPAASAAPKDAAQPDTQDTATAPEQPQTQAPSSPETSQQPASAPPAGKEPEQKTATAQPAAPAPEPAPVQQQASAPPAPPSAPAAKEEPASAQQAPAPQQEAAAPPVAAPAAPQEQVAAPSPQPNVAETTVAKSPRVARAVPADERAAAAARSASQPAKPEAAETQVVFDTVDYEDTGSAGKVFLSGVADPGARLTIYLNNDPIADVVAGPDGKWTVAQDRRLEPGSYVMRADQVLPGGKVVSRAEVTFERAPPEAVVASLEKAEAEMKANEDAREAETAAAEPQKPVAAPSAAEQAQQPAATQPRRRRTHYVVREGDTLWDIAERYYGEGWRYTAIFRRNRNQIRNPHWIYPNQRFRVPN